MSEQDNKQAAPVPNGPEQIDIANVCDGAMVEAFNLELQAVLKNIYDLNTPASKRRSIKLTLDLKPREDRVQIDCEFHCESRLAAITPKTSRVFVARDNDGNLYALTQDPRQMNIFEPPKPQALPPVITFTVAK